MQKIILILLFILGANMLNAKVIAKIPEASGICFIKKSNTLIVSNDEGWLYELKTNGKILRKKYLGKYDLEGVAYDKSNGKLLLCVEKKLLKI